MKKTLFFPLLTAALFSTAAASAQTQMTRQTRFEGQNITGIAAGNNFDVEIYQSDKTSASIEIPAELEKKLIFNIDGNGVVTLGLTGNFLSKKQDDLKAKIYLKNLKSLKASSNAEIKAMNPFTAASVVIDLSSSGKIDDLELTASERVVIDAKSSGEIDATITTPLLRADLTSSADGEIVHNGAQGVFNLGSSAELTISGKVGEVTVTTTSASGFHGENYTIDKATLKASSTSRITVGDVQTLSAQASSAAGIRYKGDPKITSLDTSSAGSIKKLD